MPKFQLLQCEIALAADVLNVVVRGPLAPVTYPELLVVKFIHGELSVREVYDVGHVEREDDAEMARLTQLYGAELVRNKLFPGAGARLPKGDNRYGPPPVRPLPAQVVDAPLDDATGGPEGADAASADYSEHEPEGSYTPREPAPAAVPVKRRTAVPVDQLNAPPLA